jgi:4-amino-4-deoxy-L-arabinose transferase-like glycosyltransferase
VSVVATLLVLPPIGQRVIATSDEARFALLARDVLERGVWFDLQVRGKPYRNKPPLYPWSIAALSRLQGRVTEVTARAPVALAAIGTVLFTFLLGDRLFGRRAGLWAALILTTSFGFFAHSQIVLPDMLVLGFATVAGYAFWRAVAEPLGRGALVAFYAALALGVFAKGPVGLLPLLVAGIWLWTEYGPRTVTARLWSPVGVSVFALITLVWLGPFLALGSRSFVGTVLWQDWLEWYLGLPTAKTLTNAAVDAIVGFLPWTVVAPLALVTARARMSAAVRFALLWFLVPLLVILLAENQRTRYLLLIYPGLALLTAWWADAHGTIRTIAGRVLGWVSLGVAAGAIVALVVPRLVGLEQRPFALGLSWEALPIVAGEMLAGVALFHGLRAGRPALLVYGVIAGMVVVLGYGIWPYTQRFNEHWDFRRLAASIERHADGREAGVFGGNVYGGRWFSMDFYVGRPLRSIQTIEEFHAYLARAERPIVVVRDPIWRMIQQELSMKISVLEQMAVGEQNMLIVRLDR